MKKPPKQLEKYTRELVAKSDKGLGTKHGHKPVSVMLPPEEIQRTIEGMISVQKGLQDSQLQLTSTLDRLSGDIAELRQGISDLKEISQRHERRIEQLIGYSITGDRSNCSSDLKSEEACERSERLDLLERFQGLERRVRKLEEK